MPHNPNFTTKRPYAYGRYAYSAAEHGVWGKDFTQQMDFLRPRACRAYLDGVAALGLTPDFVPQVSDVDARLASLTGAGVEGADAIIPQEEFSNLLSQRKFPVGNVLRRREDMNDLRQPDIFHDVFGRAPMLANEPFCQFIEWFGTLALTLPRRQIKHLYRIFWFTVEFGMIREDGAIKVFGAGITTSPARAAFATSGEPEMLDFDLETVLRTDYRIDIVQPVYFVIDRFEQLVEALKIDVVAAISQAIELGDLPPRFEAAA